MGQAGIRLLTIGAFGIMGVFSRYFAGIWISQVLPPPFPYATLLINVAGSFLIGVLYVMGAERALLSMDLFAGIAVGFLGGFTTFSSFSLETFRLFEEARYLQFTAYILGSPALGALAAAAGVLITRRFA
ncbi:MAG: hypothetical protein A2X94_12490 [Bdellovibrionales bacterium GWB1_55_8]|nr:MAG: hypothetical protein A2X94_12490 [Bdellovibrionales bacterium GWB1_55_8]